jgi:hypothetical protein
MCVPTSGCVFLDNPATREEFVTLVTASHPNLI